MRALASRRWLSGGSMLLSLRCILKDGTIGHGGTGPGGQVIQEQLVASSASTFSGVREIKAAQVLPEPLQVCGLCENCTVVAELRTGRKVCCRQMLALTCK